ncbi:MAG: hypothetical protein BMS9Abin33_1106 [Gammaproteobacteria bacterium]|nr:MAG: hypothetical protein BMS9Abin33_1106 [Gammaproteobacteria bacterium]
MTPVRPVRDIAFDLEKNQHPPLTESTENTGKPKEKSFDVTNKKGFDLPVTPVRPVRDKAFSLLTFWLFDDSPTDTIKAVMKL